MSDFPISNVRLPFSLIPAGGLINAVTPSTCDGQNDDADRERIVVFSIEIQSGLVITNSAAMFCRPSFQIQQSAVTIDQSQNLKSVDYGTPLNAPKNLTALAIFKAIQKTMYVDLAREAFLEWYYPPNVRYRYTNNFVTLILMSSGSKDPKDLWDAEIMARGAQKVFKEVAVQLAKEYFFTATSTIAPTELEGTAKYKQQRLFVQSQSLQAFESILCVLAVLYIYSVFHPRRHTIPQDPASIARLSSIISRSRNLNASMSSTGSLSLKILESLLLGSYGAAFLKNLDKINNKAPRFVIKSYKADDPKLIPLNTKY
jgi:hypothetical protein